LQHKGNLATKSALDVRGMGEEVLQIEGYNDVLDRAFVVKPLAFCEVAIAMHLKATSIQGVCA
jgi:hypothetical protein